MSKNKTNFTELRKNFEKIFNKTVGRRKNYYQLKDIMEYLNTYNVDISKRTVQRYMHDKVKSKQIKRNGHKYLNKL
ncbi:MAG: hypothetical protein QXL18_01785 [Candidatus Woesearchaeota archaeon]